MFKNLEIIDYIKSIEKEIENKQLKNILKKDVEKIIEQSGMPLKIYENLEIYNIVKCMNDKELNKLNFIFEHWKFSINHFKGNYKIKLDYIKDFFNFIKNISILFFILIKFNDTLDISIIINTNIMLFCILILLIICIILYFLENKYIKNIKLIDEFYILLDYYNNFFKGDIKNG